MSEKHYCTHCGSQSNIYYHRVSPGIVDALIKFKRAVLKKGEVIKGLEKIGAEPRGSTAAEGAALLKSEFDMWKKVIVTGNIKAE